MLVSVNIEMGHKHDDGRIAPFIVSIQQKHTNVELKMKTYAMVAIFVCCFLVVVCNALAENPLGERITTPSSDYTTSTDSFQADKNLRVVLLLGSSLITLLALIKKTWNDAGNIPIYKRPIWPWGHLALFAIVVILVVNYVILDLEKEAEMRETLARTTMIEQLNQAQNTLVETKNELGELGQKNAQLSGSIKKATSQIDSNLDTLQYAQRALETDLSQRTELLREYINEHVVETLGTLADTTDGVPSMIKKNTGLISKLTDPNEGVSFMLNENKGLIKNLTTPRGDLFRKIDVKNKKVDSVLAGYGRLDMFINRMIDTKESEDLVRRFFQVLSDSTRFSEFRHILSQDFADYTKTDTPATDTVSYEGGIAVPYGTIEVGRTEIQGSPTLASARFSWRPLQETAVDTGASTDVPTTTAIPQRISRKAFMLFVIENDSIASISGTWNVGTGQ